MKNGEGRGRARAMLLGAMLLVGMLLVAMLLEAPSGCGHDPNHDINLEQARAAANRVHTPPRPDVKMTPGAGG